MSREKMLTLTRKQREMLTRLFPNTANVQAFRKGPNEFVRFDVITSTGSHEPKELFWNEHRFMWVEVETDPRKALHI